MISLRTMPTKCEIDKTLTIKVIIIKRSDRYG